MRITKALGSLLLSPRAAMILMLWAPLAAHATDLTFSIGAQAEYDDNALRQGGDEEDDVLFRFSPQVRLHEDRGQDFRYSLSYEVPFEFAVENGDELDDIDHVVRGRVSYHPNDRLELYVSDDFRYLRSALGNVTEEEVLTGEGTLLVNQERDRVTLNDAAAGARYQFTPRLYGEASLSHDLFASDRRDRADNWLVDGTGSLNYVLTPKHTVGLGAGYIHQDFDERTNIPGSTADTYRVFGQWIYRFSETLQFQIAAGPALVDTRQDDPIGSTTTVAIPTIPLPAGITDLSTTNLVNVDGTPAAGAPDPGSRVASQLAACPTVVGTMTQVFVGGPCFPANPTPATAGIYIPGLNGALLNAVNQQVPVTDPFAEGEDDTTFQIYGLAVLRKDWSEDFHSALRYERTQSDASGLGGAVVSDSATLSNTWDITELWQFAVRGDWVLRRSIVDEGVSQFLQAGDPMDPLFTGTTPAGAVGLVTIRGGNSNEIDTMRYGVAGRLTRRFTRNTYGWLQLTYNEQTSDNGTLGDPSDFENFLAVVGVRHVFDPIKLW